MQEPYRVEDRSNHLLNNGPNFAEWASGLNRVLCIAFNSELLVNNNPLLLENQSPQENRAILHFINAAIPPKFALCIGIIPACTSSKDFFCAIKARCCPGNCFQKLKVVHNLLGVSIENGAGHPQSNTMLILTLHRAFAMFKKLGFDADELEGLLAQAVCHAPPNVSQVALYQLVTAAILAKGDKKPLSMFIGQVIMNADPNQCPSPFIYCMSEPLAPVIHPPRPCSPFFSKQAMCTVPLNISLTNSGGHAFTADVKDTDTGVSIHLSGSHHFATTVRDIPPFHIFFADSNLSVTISQTTMLKLLVKNGFVIIRDVPFSQKISGTILSVGCLCRVGIVPLFNGLSLSLLVSTTFVNYCWWMDVVRGKETSWSAAASSSPCLLETNPISLPNYVLLSPCNGTNAWAMHAINLLSPSLSSMCQILI
ncbi:hypothetical protein O181_083005 [Austropuccinia psidii MF-1]|uniref:Uncharacterized protein n=1 Tax=Austropuccinia psidii MF-1 TaxID=1389203 RepID=A0A9Q3FSY2_9BASI|nr:hypothetical protein [Austropuccinia psidii MF-1]